jgi:hypothetical protein
VGRSSVSRKSAKKKKLINQYSSVKGFPRNKLSILWGSHCVAGVSPVVASGVGLLARPEYGLKKFILTKS